MKRYLPSVKQYIWILLVCVVLSSAAGFVLAKKQPPVYQVSSTILVQTGAPGTSITTLTSTSDPTQSLAEANTYASEIPTRQVMLFIVKQYPALQTAGFTADDLLGDVTAVASTTAATVAITADANTIDDAVLLANRVADGFILYNQQQSQAELNALRKDLTTQLTTYQTQQQQLEATLAKITNTNDPNYIFTNNSLGSVNRYIDTIQGQLLTLPSTVSSDSSVVQYAEGADATVATKTSVIVAATAAVGLIIGILIMLLLIFLDDRLRGDDQVQQRLGMAYLGSVTSSGELASKPTRLSGRSLEEISDVYAGLSLTGLKSSQWRAPHGGVLLVTSAQHAEGKTTLTAALAASFASAGGSVVVIDGNLRKPGTHLAFGMASSNVGLNTLLKSSGNVDDVVQRSNIPGVWILPAGAPIADPTILLEQKLPSILEQMRNKTDMIIIDGPSLLSNADAILLAKMSDCVMMVVDVRHDKMPLLLRAKELLNALAKMPSGVVMNRAPKRNRNKYYATAPVVNMEAKPEALIAVQNHNGNGQKSDALIVDMAAVRTSTPPPIMGNVSPTPGGRPSMVPVSMPMDQQTSGSLLRPLSSPGNIPDLPPSSMNIQQAKRQSWTVPPSPNRSIPPTP